VGYVRHVGYMRYVVCGYVKYVGYMRYVRFVVGGVCEVYVVCGLCGLWGI
jgi:hypothetical protein